MIVVQLMLPLDIMDGLLFRSLIQKFEATFNEPTFDLIQNYETGILMVRNGSLKWSTISDIDTLAVRPEVSQAEIYLHQS